MSTASGAQMYVQVDGTPGAIQRGIAGVGVVVRGPTYQVLTWHCARAPATTSNEAEYQALIVGLQFVSERYPHARVCCLSDSRMLVEQMHGQCAVRAPGLRPLHAQAVALARKLTAVAFVFIPRELNRLADALAWEAVSGREELGDYLKQQT